MKTVKLKEWEIARRIQNIESRKRTASHLNAFINLIWEHDDLEEYAEVRLSRPLLGRSVGVKDNIVTSKLPTTCGSKMLANFSSPYEATVVGLIRNAGGVVIAKTNLDEFGMGSYSIHSHFGPVKGKKMPDDRILTAGGSSGGSAVTTVNHTTYLALGTDTGGSVRLPAAYTSIVGFKPSYGLISRWGVVSYANSMDTVGILSRDVWTARRIFEKLSQYDEKDPTSLSQESRARIDDRTQKRMRQLKSLKIGIPKEYNIEEMSPLVRDFWLKTINILKDLRHTIHVVSLPSTKEALSAYYILAPAEASSNLAKYDGVRYGTRVRDHTSTQDQRRVIEPDQANYAGDEGSRSVLFSKTREAGFGAEVKRRILLGSYSLSAKAMDNYFIQAQKIRRLVLEDFDKVFALPNIASTSGFSETADGVDIILSPTAPTEPPALADLTGKSPLDAYVNDVFTVPASLAGLPAISVPISKWLNLGKTVAPIGMQIIAQYGDDQVAIALADQLERFLAPGKVSSEHFGQKRRELFWSS